MDEQRDPATGAGAGRLRTPPRDSGRRAWREPQNRPARPQAPQERPGKGEGGSGDEPGTAVDYAALDAERRRRHPLEPGREV